MKSNTEDLMRKYLDAVSFDEYLQGSCKVIRDNLNKVVYGITISFEGQETKSFVLPVGTSRTFLEAFLKIFFDLTKISRKSSQRFLDEIKDNLRKSNREFHIL